MTLTACHRRPPNIDASNQSHENMVDLKKWKYYKCITLQFEQVFRSHIHIRDIFSGRAQGVSA